MVTRKEQKEKRIEEILVTALELFVKKGYASTKTSDIAKAVNMSDGLLFHYFKSKEVLYETLIDIALQTNEKWLAIGDMPALEALRVIIESVFKSLKEDSYTSKFFLLVIQARQADDIPVAVKKRVNGNDEQRQILLNMVIKGQKDKTIREGNPLAMIYLFNGIIQNIAIQYATIPDMPLPEVDWILDIFRNKL